VDVTNITTFTNLSYVDIEADNLLLLDFSLRSLALHSPSDLGRIDLSVNNLKPVENAEISHESVIRRLKGVYANNSRIRVSLAVSYQDGTKFLYDLNVKEKEIIVSNNNNADFKILKRIDLIEEE
ncbi:MAG: hypothetical protein WA057_00815, partial [Candidatus Magasanikiibacteriota bacterium]